MPQDETLNEELRKHPRVKDRLNVHWRLRDGVTQGQARVIDISESGMKMEMHRAFDLNPNTLLTFDESKKPLPRIGRLVWAKALAENDEHKECGVEFVDPEPQALERLQRKVEKEQSKSDKKKIVVNIIGTLLALVFTVMIAVVVWLSYETYQGVQASHQQMAGVVQNYQGLYEETQAQLSQTSSELTNVNQLYQVNQAQLADVSAKLQNTQILLTETEQLLMTARQNNADLAKMSEQQIQENQDTIAALQSQNTELNFELKSLQDELAFYSGNVDSMEASQEWMARYRANMRKVKDKIRSFRKRARKLEKVARKEQDRLQSAIGNNGFFIKNGETVNVDMERYESVGADQPAEPSPSAQDNIKINVQNF